MKNLRQRNMMQPLRKQNFSFGILILLISMGLFLLCLVTIFGLWKIYSIIGKEPIPEAMHNSESKLSNESPPPEFRDEVVSEVSTLEVLNQVEIPLKDLYELSERFKGFIENDIQTTDSALSLDYVVGDARKFWKLDVDANTYIQTDANLEYITPHLYFWVEQGVDFNHEDLEKLAETFESEIYPLNRSVFGSELTPGVDKDDHLVILFAKGLGGVGGYFSSTDMLSKELEQFSNQAEMFYLSADYTDLGDTYTFGVLAHEFQHMIHWNADRNESAWISEGLSELAVDINNYETGGFDYLFAYNPDLQLNFWPGNDQGYSAPHYGAAHLFMRYMYDRIGEPFIKELVMSPLNGIESIDAVLKKIYVNNNVPMTFEKVFQDWSIANFLNGRTRFSKTEKYGDIPNFPIFSSTEILTCDSLEWSDRTVSQFGTDYIEINCPADFLLELIGDQQVNLLPVNPHSDDHYFWSNYGDESDIKLSKTFDFSSATAPIILSYWTWYDIERDYDYLYLTATENEISWEILKTPSCDEDDPTGANYGCGYNGKSNGWIEEHVDLSKFAGKIVTLQFDYITDMAVNGDGFLIDDVSIDSINYSTDFEEDQGGWIGEGFVRIKNTLPQDFAVTILKNETEEPTEQFFSDGGLLYSLEMSHQNGINSPMIVISGITRYTYQPAKYRIKITKIE